LCNRKICGPAKPPVRVLTRGRAGKQFGRYQFV
jgi:hypothetical protein